MYEALEKHVEEISESEIAAIEVAVEEDAENWAGPDDHFFVIPDDVTKTLIVCPAENKYSGIKLNATTAEIMIEIIRRQLQSWL